MRVFGVKPLAPVEGAPKSSHVNALNTVVFPAAYGGDPTIGAAMATVSHTLCVASIPLMYSLLTLLIGGA